MKTVTMIVRSPGTPDERHEWTDAEAEVTALAWAREHDLRVVSYHVADADVVTLSAVKAPYGPDYSADDARRDGHRAGREARERGEVGDLADAARELRVAEADGQPRCYRRDWLAGWELGVQS